MWDWPNYLSASIALYLISLINQDAHYIVLEVNNILFSHI